VIIEDPTDGSAGAEPAPSDRTSSRAFNGQMTGGSLETGGGFDVGGDQRSSDEVEDTR
jgi:hypothetical protein